MEISAERPSGETDTEIETERDTEIGRDKEGDRDRERSSLACRREKCTKARISVSARK